MPKPRLSWRKEPRERGLAGVARSTPYGFDLFRNGEHIVCVRWAQGRWYWYGYGSGPHHNTLCRLESRTFTTPDEAKADAVAWVKANPTPEVA